MTFKELGLRPELIEAVTELGFVTPSPIQQKAIPLIIDSDKDLIGSAQTGTGKTAAFGLPLLNKIDINNKDLQGLILSPTRELTIQIANELKKYSKYLKGAKIVTVYGGASIDTQIRDLKKSPQIVVGTPGRTLDLIKRKKIKVDRLSYMVLDEADEMLSMGFKDDLDEILKDSPDDKQALLFSATIPPEIRGMVNQYMNDPVQVSVMSEAKSNENITHECYVVNQRERYTALKRLIDVNTEIYGIIFCRTRRETKDIAEKLAGEGYNTDALHGDLSQAQRDYVMNKFRKKKIQLLLATDVAARGLDVNDLTHAINYNLPDSNDVYVHRTGRVGRAENLGVSMSIVTPREYKGQIKQLQKKIGKEITIKKVPEGNQVLYAQLNKVLENFEAIEVDQKIIAPYMLEIMERLQDYSREDIIEKFVASEFSKFLDYYKGSKDINADPNSARGKFDRNDRNDRGGRRGDRDRGQRNDRKSNDGGRSKRRDGDYDRFFINLGKKQHLEPRKLMGLLNKELNNFSFEIGAIDINKGFSHFEIEKGYSSKVLNGLKGKKYRGFKINVEEAKPKR